MWKGKKKTNMGKTCLGVLSSTDDINLAFLNYILTVPTSTGSLSLPPNLDMYFLELPSQNTTNWMPKASEMCYIVVWSPKSRCQQGSAPFENSSGEFFLAYPSFQWSLQSLAVCGSFCGVLWLTGGILWLAVTSLQSPVLSSLGILLVSRFLSSYKDTSDVGFRAHLNPI